MVPEIATRVARWPALSCLLAMLATHYPAHARDGASACPDRVREVQSLERAWLDAYTAHDPEAMARILSPGFSITYANASVDTRDEVIANMRMRRGQAGQRYWTEDVSGRCFGATVILVGWVVSSGGSRERYTDTYVRDEGRWVVAASHLSAQPK